MRDFWIFAYGSLMWAPGFPVAEQVPAYVRGWHRRFSLSSPRSWGTPAAPGLCAALHEGGECAGLVLRIGAAYASDVRESLERREAAYRFREVRARAPDGRDIIAVTFVWDPAEPRFMPGLTICAAAAMIRTSACGRMGRSTDYLARTVETLEEAGFEATPERVLLAAVRAKPCAREKAPA